VARLILLIILAASLLYGYRVYQQRFVPVANKPLASVLSAETSASSSASPSGTWKIFKDEKIGFRIRYPSEIDIKQTADGVYLFSRQDIHISLIQGKLAENETINTLAEKQINQKMEKLADKFKLVDTISDVAIGSLTGISYKSEESQGTSIYFYIPQGSSHYLLINNQIDSPTDQEVVSLSDQIIYSLELLP